MHYPFLVISFDFPAANFFRFHLYSAYYMIYIAGMPNHTEKELQKERAGLLAELATLSRLLHGSWVKRYSVCSRPDCKCRRGERHGPRHYLVVSEAGRQRQKYVANSQVKAAMEGLAQHRRLREIVDRITQLNLDLMKERMRKVNSCCSDTIGTGNAGTNRW